MTERCTCCAVHGLGAHSQTTTPPRMIDPPELVSANAARDKATAAAERLREIWAKAFLAEDACRTALQKTYRYHPKGVRGATRDERRELERLQSITAEKYETWQKAARREVEARQAAAEAQHRATQQTLTQWAQEAHE